MSKAQTLKLLLRRRELVRDECGYAGWKAVEAPAKWPAGATALVLCDVWDAHTCRGAVERLEAMVPRMDRVVRAARRKGVLIVHAPSDTMDFYADAPARRRAVDAPLAEPPADLRHDDPPLPVAAKAPCDTDDNPPTPPDRRRPWTRQHPGIGIDQDRDVISDSGRELFNVYRRRGVGRVLILGVHTGMCILNRTFAIKQMVRWGFAVALVRDLTDAMYNPAEPPYVSHAEGTRLVVEYIEKFWCSTVLSRDLLGTGRRTR